MVITLIIVLVIALLVISVIMNAVQQHKERLATLKRAEYSKLRAMLEDTEEILLNAANVPLTPGTIKMLLNRIAYTLKAMVELEPNSRDLKSRLSDTEKRINEMGNVNAPHNENISLPDNDKQIISMIQGIKKLRTILRGEHARGNVDTQLVQEDRRLENLQLRINVESQVKRGNMARSNHMLGSARQCYEKALATLANATTVDEYVQSRKNEVNTILSDIAEELKEGNMRDRQKKLEAENNDLDVLFAPKRKW